MFPIYYIRCFETLVEESDALVSGTNEEDALNRLELFLRNECAKKRIELGYFRIKEGGVNDVGKKSSERGVMYLPGRDILLLNNS